MDPFFLLLPIFVIFCLWLAYRIIEKAGFDGRWALVLLIPVVNILMIWVFALCKWPLLQDGGERDF